MILGALLSCLLVGIPVWRMNMKLQENRYDALILSAAAENGCDPSLIKAMVWRESKFDPNARGKDGEIGLMQVMPVVAAEWATAHSHKKFDPHRLIDPGINLRIGTWHLSRALQRWAHASDPVSLALAQYNAGRSNVLKWVDAGSMTDGEYFVTRIQFPSTQGYVRDILKQHRFYRNRGEF